MNTLERYFDDHGNNGVLAFTLHTSKRNGRVFATIHPNPCNNAPLGGPDVEFVVIGNVLVPANPAECCSTCRAAGEDQEQLHRIFSRQADEFARAGKNAADDYVKVTASLFSMRELEKAARLLAKHFAPCASQPETSKT